MEDESPAQKLLSQHTAHQPTVEEVVDEEDLAHPPPSSVIPTTDVESPIPPANGAAGLSEKALGKQRAQEPPPTTTTKPKPQTTTIDVNSEEAFPSLGGPKPVSQQSSMWGSRPMVVNQNNANGIRPNGAAKHASRTSSGTSTPASGLMTPSSEIRTGANAPLASRPTQGVNLPGRYTEDMRMPVSQVKQRGDMKRSVQDVIRDINRRSKATVEMARVENLIVFKGQGPSPEAVQQVLKEVAAQVGITQKIRIPIPASVRPHIIGKQGSTIQGIIKRSGARVQMPRSEVPLLDRDDDDTTVDIEIEGNPMATTLARTEIENLVKQRTSTVNVKMREIPAEFFPFIAGAHNSRINAIEEGRDVRVKVPHYHTWRTQPPPPQPAANERADFKPQDGHHIQISGDREIAREVQADIERQVQELQDILTLNQISVERELHQFIVGERGASLHDFLEETGCSIVLPPSEDDTEILTVIGPPDQIDNGVNKAMDLASTISAARLDVTKHHPRAVVAPQSHPRDLARYLRHRQALQPFEQRYDAHVLLPRPGGDQNNWQIYSRDPKNTMRARSDIINLLIAHPPTRFRNVDVHPFYQRQLQQVHAQPIRDAYGVHMIVPDESEEHPQVLLIYEGSQPVHEYTFPNSQPSEAEIQQFESALAEAERHLLEQIGQQEEIVQRSLPAPLKYREKIQRMANRTESRGERELVPVQFLGLDDPLGAGASTAEFPVVFRGPSAAVDDYAEKLAAFIEEQIKDEAERDYVTTFDFPQKFANVLIGKRGENINKLRDEFDVDIQVNEGKVDVKGPKAKADAAKAHILSLGRKLEDETTHLLKIPPKFHGDLIGTKGNQVLKLQTRYNVRILFPRTSPSPRDDQSLADGASDAGATPARRTNNQGPDEVIIKGPRKGADEAKEELWGLFKYLQDNSHVALVSVAQSQLPSLIGQGGRELDAMRLQTGAQIDVPGARDAVDPSGRVEVTVKGTKTAVESARKLLEEKAKSFDNTIIRTLEVDKKHHRALIGREGENIRQITQDAGAVGDPRTLARMVQFPKADAAESTIRVEGNKEVVDKIIAAMEAFVSLRATQVTETMEVPPARHGALIGRGGETRRNLETDLGISLAVPNISATGPERSIIRITGQPDSVQKAKDRIQALLKSQEGETIQVPSRLHHAIIDMSNGNFFRELSREHRVAVDHGGQPKPPRPADPVPTITASTTLPLITDEHLPPAPSAADIDALHKFELHPAVPAATASEPTYPWILKGPSADALAAAHARILAAVAAADASKVGFLVLPDPKLHRLVIGPGGATINQIRRATGAKIDVPNAGQPGAPIEIRGTEEGVEEAKRMIVEAVKGGAR